MLLSDPVLMTLITSVGSIIATTIPTLAVVLNRRKTDTKIDKMHDDVKNAVSNSGQHPTTETRESETAIDVHDDGRRSVEQ